MSPILHTIIILCAFYGMTFILKDSSIFDKPRIWLIRQHPVFYSLFSCYACVGFHSGYLVYLLSFHHFDWREFILFGLAGASVSYIVDIILQRLMRE
jgi:hypothetical protein